MSSFPLIARPTDLNTDCCLNSRHHQAACARCADLCPTRALTVSEAGDVTLALDACLGCGLCLHACPAEVFTTSRWSERTPLANIVEVQANRFDVYCAWRQDAGVGAQGSGSVQLPTCLAAMSPGIWFELGLKGDVRVRLEACAGCPLESAANAVERAVETANAWLHDCGYEHRVTCVRIAEDVPSSVRRAVVTGEHEYTSRRGFFRSLFSAAKKSLDDAANTHEMTWTGDQSPKQQPRLPAWMAHAAQAYAQHSHPSAEPTALWPSIIIDSTCTHCTACTNYCPTGALETSLSADRFAITFNPGQCVDCRICWASCPAGAITRSQQPTVEPFVRRPVLQRPVSSCIHCGQPAETGRTVCYWCAEEPPLNSVVSDARRWLFAAPIVPLVDQIP